MQSREAGVWRHLCMQCSRCRLGTWQEAHHCGLQLSTLLLGALQQGPQTWTRQGRAPPQRPTAQLDHTAPPPSGGHSPGLFWQGHACTLHSSMLSEASLYRQRRVRRSWHSTDSLSRLEVTQKGEARGLEG